MRKRKTFLIKYIMCYTENNKQNLVYKKFLAKYSSYVLT